MKKERYKKRTGKILFLALMVMAFLAGIFQWGWSLNRQEAQEKREIFGIPQETAPLLAPGTAVRMTVLSQQNWTDTGYRVLEGQEILFQSSGVISLQAGNPIAFPCGPEGLNMLTLQKPMREENIGSLIGKVVQVVGIEVDERTGEETPIEKEMLFFIGPRNQVRIPLSGRLFLGVNELVVGDNQGVFSVLLYLTDTFTNREDRF
jgi:hypothetical protein